MKSLAEIKTILREAYPELSKKYSLSELAIFGSYVRGEQTTDSDIDLFFSSNNKNLSAFDILDFQYTLEDLFHQPIDVVLKETIRQEYLSQILSEAVYL